jgi:CRP-like cAMP-binding protein/CheY-like chemotaxis protein
MKKILLIEDNPEMRENTAEILELANFEVITAENGKKGVKSAQEHKPDLIICDIMIPELDGYSVLHILSKDHATATIPFIFLTAKADRNDFRKGMNLGADDYITKPFDETELLNAVESRLKKTEVLKQEFGRDAEGLDNFIREARGLEELKRLPENRKTKVFKKKEIIFYEKNFPSGLYFINKGKVKTFKSNDEGKDYITGLYKEGDFLGYVALLEDSNYSETAMALEDTEVSIIPREDFNDLMYKNRDVSNKFIRMLSNDLKAQEERLVKLAYNSVRKRVADSLMMLYKRYKKSENEDTFKMSVSREDLASMVGTAPESVIRVLSDFKSEKIIEIQASNITILNPAKLEGMKN